MITIHNLSLTGLIVYYIHIISELPYALCTMGGWVGDTIWLLWLQHWWLTESCHDPKFTQHQLCSGIDLLMYMHCTDVIATRSVNSNCTSILYKSLPLPIKNPSRGGGGGDISIAWHTVRGGMSCLAYIVPPPSLDEALPKIWKECLVCWSRRVPHRILEFATSHSVSNGCTVEGY